MLLKESLNELRQRFDMIAQEGTLSDLKNVNNELVLLKNEIDNKLKQSFHEASDMNLNIDQIANKTRLLRTRIDGLKDKDAGSVQMYHDIRNIYNQRLLGNWLLFIIASCGGIFFFKNRK